MKLSDLFCSPGGLIALSKNKKCLPLSNIMSMCECHGYDATIDELAHMDDTLDN